MQTCKARAEKIIISVRGFLFVTSVDRYRQGPLDVVFCAI